MQSLRHRLGSAFRSTFRTSGIESVEERPPSPGVSTIKSNRSKKSRNKRSWTSIFKPNGKRTRSGPLPVGDDSTTTLPKPLEVSSTGALVPDETKRECTEPLDPQPNQASVEGTSSAHTTEQELQSTREEQTEVAAAIPQNPTPNDPSHIYSSITYVDGAQRLSQDTTPPTTAEGDTFGIEAPKPPTEACHTVGWVQHTLPHRTYYYTRTVAPSVPMGGDSFTLVTDSDLEKEGVLKSVEAEVADVLLQPRGFTNQGAFDLWVYADSDSIGVKSESSGTNTPSTTSKINLRWISHASRTVVAYPVETANNVVSTSPVAGAEETERKKASTELAYWEYIENHPAHTILAQGAKEEAVDALKWSHTDWLLHQDHPVPNAFEQEECKDLLRLIGGVDTQDAGAKRIINTQIIARVLSRICKHRLDCLGKSSQEQSDALDPRSEVRTTFPSLRLLVCFLVPLVYWGMPYLFLGPAVTDPIAEFRQSIRFGGLNHASGGQWEFPPFEDASLATERQANAMLYVSGFFGTVCLAALFELLQLQHVRSSLSLPSQPPNRQRFGKRRQAVVVLGTTTALLTMRPPTDPPTRAAGLVALVCAGASFVASGIAVARLWRLSSSTYHSGTGSSFFSDTLPVAMS